MESLEIDSTGELLTRAPFALNAQPKGCLTSWPNPSIAA